MRGIRPFGNLDVGLAIGYVGAAAIEDLDIRVLVKLLDEFVLIRLSFVLNTGDGGLKGYGIGVILLLERDELAVMADIRPKAASPDNDILILESAEVSREVEEF